MIRTDDLVTTLPEPLLPAVQQRLLDLQALIDANVPTYAKWIYTEKPSEWPKYFSSGEDKQWSLQQTWEVVADDISKCDVQLFIQNTDTDTFSKL